MPAPRVAAAIVAACLAAPLAPVPAAAQTSSDCGALARQRLGRMSLRDKAGQMVMATAHPNSNGMPSDAARQAVRRLRVGSFLVYERGGPRVAARHNNRLQAWAAPRGVPVAVAADFELGTAHRISNGVTALPLQMALGAVRRPADAATAARITAREARAMGFHWSLAPVADVNTNPRNPVIGVRSFGSSPKLAARLTSAQVRAYRDEGVAATPKHFPGHGATSVDSHTGLPVVGYGRRVLNRRHLPPFRAAVAAGAPAIMTAHVVLRAVDARRPATLSRKVITGILRRDLGFGGVVITDAMTMRAISDRWGTAQAARMAVSAGADMIMATGSLADQSRTVRAIRRAVTDGHVSPKRLHTSVIRILRMKCRLGLFEGTRVSPAAAARETGTRAARRASRDIARRSVTMLRNRRVLPLRKRTKGRILVAGVSRVPDLAKRVRRVAEADVITWRSRGMSPSDAEIRAAVARARRAKRIVVTTYSRGALPAGQARLVRALVGTGKPVVAVALGLPHDIASYRRVPAYLVASTQGPWPHRGPPLLGLVDVLFGANPEGRLPVRIPGMFRFGAGRSY